MKIKEINILEFGCLKNKVIKPDAGMNIIYGENESGKSTVMLFIKFILYGFGRKGASNSDRERSISWSGHTAAGSMTFEHAGREYRIERRYTDGGRSGSEKLRAVCLDDGGEITTDKSMGEYFLGVPKEVFESSAYVGQMRATSLDGEKTAASIRNMLTSADESVDTAKILKSLDLVRVGYLHKNKNGGSLYEDEQRISATRQRLEKTKDASFFLEEQIQRLEKAKNDYAIVKRELEEKDTLISEINKVNILERFRQLDKTREEKERLTAKKERLTADGLKTEFFPDRNHIAELRLCARALSDAQRTLDERKEELKEKESSGYNSELADLGERLEQAGGAEALLSAVNDKKKKSRLHSGVVTAVWAAQGALSVAAAAFMLLGYAWGAALFAFLVPTILLTARSVNVKRKLKAEILDISAEYGVVPERLGEKLAQCTDEAAKKREHLSIITVAKAELALAERTYLSCEVNLTQLMEKTMPNVEPTCSAAQNEVTRLESFIAAYEDTTREEEALLRVIKNEEAALSSYNAEELRNSLSVDVNDITPAAVSEAQRVRGFLAAKKASLEQRVMSLGNSVAELRVSSEDPLAIADELAELEAKAARDREFYDALTLAMEAMEQAGQIMSGSVMPSVSKRAGEIMGRISSDKYTALRTTGALGVSLDSEGFGVKSEYLSGGTRDAAYLALRLALFDRIYGEERPPLILDEAFCQLDGERATRLLEMLCELSSADIQCLCFTSHKREAEICHRIGAEYKSIRL